MGRFTDDEMAALGSNPFVERVFPSRINYTEEFKERARREWEQGKSSYAIFRDAGFDMRLVGRKRAERAVANFRESPPAPAPGAPPRVDALVAKTLAIADLKHELAIARAAAGEAMSLASVRSAVEAAAANGMLSERALEELSACARPRRLWRA